MSHYTTFEERLEIENGLRENLSFGEIAKRLRKDRSTVSREVKKYATAEKSGYGVLPTTPVFIDRIVRKTMFAKVIAVVNP